MRRFGFPALLALCLAAAVSTPARATVYFTEDFSDNSLGWVLGPEWMIGPAAASTGHGTGYPDPGVDTTPTSDNGVAGAVIGGNIPVASLHPFYYITSPNISLIPSGSVFLRFRRWLNSDYVPYEQNVVEVSSNGGGSWITVWSSGGSPGVTDNTWTTQSIDVTAYKSATFRVRFGYNIGSSGAVVTSGWNLDDIMLWNNVCDDVDGDGHGALSCGGDDCDDSNASIHPGATDICDDIDNDCDGLVDEDAITWYPDADGDGYGTNSGSMQACSAPSGFVPLGGDCNDSNDQIHPGAIERLNGVDDDCDGLTDEGFESPIIRFVRDVPNDQGRYVRIRWRRDVRDDPSMGTIVTGYAIFRRVGPGQSMASARPAALATLPPGEWDVLTTVPAFGDTVYQTVVPTLCDSNSTSFCRSTFVVRAITPTTYTYYDSAPDSGWSVDNIVPGVPSGLAASSDYGYVRLDWNASADDDFQFFRIYRGTSPSFVPGPANLVQSTASNTWTDGSTALGGRWYKVTTVDANGNESAPATTHYTVDVEGGDLPTALAIHAARPNPFTNTTTLGFDLPRPTNVRMTVLDLTGRRVRTLVSGVVEAGRHRLVWDGREDSGRRAAPGVYLLRLESEGRALSRRITFRP